MIFLFIRYIYWFIYYVLLNCNSKQTQSHTSIEDGTVSYLDVHVLWIDRQFQKHYAALAASHFGHRGSYWRAVNSILAEYGLEYGLR